jgi:peroxiredoxin Q/BCP
MPEISDLAAEFTLPRDGGKNVSLADLRGGGVVLFFYPRDDTPGCTKESIGFSQYLQSFADAQAKVFGISKDSVASHDKFATKHTLTVPLLSDENGTTCEDYGVWGEKNMYGKKFMGITRTTFFIDAQGVIVRRWDNVKVPGHVQDVLETVKRHAAQSNQSNQTTDAL